MRDRRISKVAVDLLEHRARKIQRKANKIEKLDDLHRHKLRIAVKKLRYGCDFFESLFDRPKRRAKYEEALKSVQDRLGKLNDIRIHAEKGHDWPISAGASGHRRRKRTRWAS
jgi:triphosphatase